MNAAASTPHPLLQRRSSGVLLHLTSLPGPHGCGDLGAGARHFVDWLAAAGQSCAEQHENKILTVGQFREATGISRHAVMPVLEFFDRVGFTTRHQDGRRIRVPPETIFTA